MKNQYFGDVNDYKKYSLIRLLSGKGQIETAVCWVLTEDDNKTDGSKIRYLAQPEKWQNYDPDVFDYLREQVLDKGIRNVANIERTDILPNCRFYKELVSDSVKSREDFFSDFTEFSKGAELVFFDPDNGIEVKSISRGKKSSSKYIFWDEVKTSYLEGHSLMIYQHFPRRPRELFLKSLVHKFRYLVGAKKVFSYCTYHVVFLLIPQPNHEDLFLKNNNRVKEIWGELIKVREHQISNQSPICDMKEK